ncbi:hypothetical protein N9I52_02080 [Acidimicrobiia bacterium]|nr:hypothetical protein [Acidimicrobiia bacterium]
MNKWTFKEYSNIKKLAVVFSRIFFISIIMILIFTFIPTNSSASNYNIQNLETQVNTNSCSGTTYDLVNFMKLNNLNYEITYHEDLNVLSNLGNIKCLNKVNTINKIDNSYQINVSRQNKLTSYLVVSIFLFSFLILQHKNDVNYFSLVAGYLIYLSYNFYSQSNLEKLTYLLIIIYIYKLSLSNKPPKFSLLLPVLSLIYISEFNLLNFSLFSGNGLLYVGYAFKSEGNLTAYYLQDSLWAFDALIKILIDIFNKYFYIIFKTIQAAYFILIIFVIGKIFKLKSLSILMLLILFIRYQSILADSYVIGLNSASGVAHLLIFGAFYFAFTNNLKLSTFFLILSTYLHFPSVLILAPLFMYFYLKNLRTKEIIIHLSVFLVLTSFHLIPLINSNLSQLIDKNSALETYIVFRHPHHLLPFLYPRSGLIEGVSPAYKIGILYFFVILISLLVLRKGVSSQTKLVINFSIFSNIILFFYLSLLYFFPISLFSTLFPLKISSFVIFFSLISFLKIFEEYINQSRINIKVVYIVVIAYLIVPLNLEFLNPIKSITENGNYQLNISYDGDRKELINAIKQLEKDAVVLVPYRSSEDGFFQEVEIATGMQTYVNNKFVPHNLNSIQDWYEKLTYLENFYEGDCKNFVGIDGFYYITNNEFDDLSKCGDRIFKNKQYALYRSK